MRVVYLGSDALLDALHYVCLPVSVCCPCCVVLLTLLSALLLCRLLRVCISGIFVYVMWRILFAHLPRILFAGCICNSARSAAFHCLLLLFCTAASLENADLLLDTAPGFQGGGSIDMSDAPRA